MLAILKKEWKLHMGSVATLAVTVILMVLGGATLSLFNLTLAASDISYALRAMALPCSCLIPIPIMLAARKNEKDGFDLWVRSLPLHPITVSAAKLLSSLLLFCIPSAVFVLSPFLLSLYGEINLPISYTAFLGYLLFALFWSVFSHFTVSACKHAILRPVLCIGIPATLFLLDLLAEAIPLPEWLYRALIALNPFSLFEDFTYGRFSLSATLCTLTLTALFAVLWLLTEANRNGTLTHPQKKKRAAISFFLAILIASGTTVGALLLPSTVASWDMRDTETFVVSGITKDALRALTDEVTVYYLCEGGEKNADPNLFAFLKNYDDQSELLRIRVIDTLSEPKFASLYTDAKLSNNSFIVTCKERSYVIDSSLLYHYYNAQLQKSFAPAYYAYCVEAFDHYMSTGEFGSYDETAMTYGSSLYYYSTETSVYFDGDSYLMNAIHYVTSPDLPTVYLFSGEKNTVDATLSAFLISSGYQIKHLASLAKIPEDCNLLFLYAPTKDLSDKEAAELDRFTESGGDLFLCTSCAYTDLPRLFDCLARYGLAPYESANMVCEQNTQNKDEYSYNFYASVASHAATGNFEGMFALLMPHALTVTEVEGAASASWIYSSQNACLQLPDGTQKTDSPARYTCGAVSERNGSRVVWISSVHSLGLQGYTVTGGENYRLAAEAMDWATQTRYQPLSIPSTVIPSQTLSITSGEAALLSLVLVLILPALLAIVLGIRIYLRKKK